MALFLTAITLFAGCKPATQQDKLQQLTEKKEQIEANSQQIKFSINNGPNLIRILKENGDLPEEFPTHDFRLFNNQWKPNEWKEPIEVYKKANISQEELVQRFEELPEIIRQRLEENNILLFSPNAKFILEQEKTAATPLRVVYGDTVITQEEYNNLLKNLETLTGESSPLKISTEQIESFERNPSLYPNFEEKDGKLIVTPSKEEHIQFNTWFKSLPFASRLRRKLEESIDYQLSEKGRPEIPRDKLETLEEFKIPLEVSLQQLLNKQYDIDGKLDAAIQAIQSTPLPRQIIYEGELENEPFPYRDNPEATISRKNGEDWVYWEITSKNLLEPILTEAKIIRSIPENREMGSYYKTIWQIPLEDDVYAEMSLEKRNSNEEGQQVMAKGPYAKIKFESPAYKMEVVCDFEELENLTQSNVTSFTMNCPPKLHTILKEIKEQ